jgi:hypothetical protein
MLIQSWIFAISFNLDEEFRSSTFIQVCFYPKIVFKQVLLNVYETDAHETVKIT